MLKDWYFYLTNFDFKVAYHPGSKNVKADALSRKLDVALSQEQAAPTLPSSYFTSPIVWSL